MLTYVLSKDGTPLMPTYNIKKVRHMLKDGRAVIAGHAPRFTIRLAYNLKEQAAPHVQPVEICEDAGYQHIGVSVKSEKHEFAHEQYDLPDKEKDRHDDRRKYRRSRRGHKRYRAPRFDNRRKKNGWLAPSVRNKADLHEHIVELYKRMLPLTDATVETASFDTQALEAAENGHDLPQGKDYQHGHRYGIATLREAVFFRDHYNCQCCGRNAFRDHVILRVHHCGYWKNPPDHTDRMSGLMTVCTGCHTAANHKPGGKLYGLKPKAKPMAGAAFMNAVRWMIVAKLRQEHPELNIRGTYGSVTKLRRRDACIKKTHANDAYVMGRFRPKHRAEEVCYKKLRRNNRILEKFRDSKYIDTRDGKAKSGTELSCGRTDRSESRHSEKDLRIYRGKQVSKGKRLIRQQRYPIQPGTVVLYKRKKHITAGTHCHGTRFLIDGNSVAVKKVKVIRYAGAWQAV